MEKCLRDHLRFLHKLTLATRHLASVSSDQQLQNSIIERSRDVLQRSLYFLHDVKKPHTNNLPNIAHDLSSALNACLSNIPSQRYLDEAIQQMTEYVYTLAGPFERKFPLSVLNAEDINRAAANLNQATNDLVLSTHSGGTQDLAKTSVRFSRAFGDFIDNGLGFVHHQEEDEKRSRLIISLKNVHQSSNQFLERAKSVSIEPTMAENDSKHQLANAARYKQRTFSSSLFHSKFLRLFFSAVTETINDVISACLTPKSPALLERMECDHAIREMENCKNLLQQSVSQPCTNFSYFESLDHVVENSKRLGEAMTHIASASKNINHQLFIQAVQDASKAVCRLAESSAQVEKTFFFIFYYEIIFRQVI